MTSPKRAELLLPAGSLEKLKTAVLYGADAVYAGTPDMSLRTRSTFSLEELKEGIDFAHEHGAKVYLTLNLFTHNKDIERLPGFVATLRELKPDGVIVADPGVFQFLKDEAPELPLHISTQANVVSWLTVDYWRRQGAELVVLAREVSFEELQEIRIKCPDIKLETFVHGAMCMTYSGRCLLSNYLAERGANQGSCANSCRWKYKMKIELTPGNFAELEINEDNYRDFNYYLEEVYRPGEYLPLEEDDQGSYILNSRDLNLMPKLGEYLKSGIDSLKVEGRSKNQYYAAIVARSYRAAIDSYYADPENFDPEIFLNELFTAAARGYTLGFHDGRLTNLAHDYVSGQSLSEYEFAGIVREWRDDAVIIEIRNRIMSGDVIELLPPGGLDCIRIRLYEFENAATGDITEKISAGEGRAIKIPRSAFHAEGDIDLEAILPPLSVARKSSPLSDQQATQLKVNHLTQDAELGLIPLERLRNASAGRVAVTNGKAPKLGTDACCGLGCNGCLPFWKEPKYEKARRLLAEKQDGRKLSKSVARKVILTEVHPLG